MSETPVPEARIEAASEQVYARGDDYPEGDEVRSRKRSQSARPLSAFGTAPGIHAVTKDHIEEAVKAREPQPEDDGFVADLQAAGLLSELSLAELERIVLGLQHEPGPARRIDLLEAYYAAEGDAVAALRRRATDRWFIYRGSDPIGAPQLIQRLLGVLPELSGAHLERVGSSAGTLVMRLGEHICALDDEQVGRGPATVSVLEIVRAMNVLLERKNTRARLVGLLGDGSREAYLGFPSLMNALPLVESDYLTAPDAEALMGLSAW